MFYKSECSILPVPGRILAYPLSRRRSFDQRNANSYLTQTQSIQWDVPWTQSNMSDVLWTQFPASQCLEHQHDYVQLQAINDITCGSSIMSRLSSQFSWLKKYIMSCDFRHQLFNFRWFFLVLKHTFIIYPRGWIIWAHRSDFLRRTLIDVWSGDR